MWRGRAREARQLVAGEAGRLGQAVGRMYDRCMSLAGPGGRVAIEPYPCTFREMLLMMMSVESRLRSRGPGVWRMMAWVRASGIGRVVEGLAIAGDWTAGCVAVPDAAIEEIRAVSPIGTPVGFVP